MTKSIAYVGALAAALLAISTGPAAAQSADGLSSDSLSPSSSLSGSGEGGDGSLGSLGENMPGSVTGSLPGFATGPIGSAGNLACNVGSAANLAGNLAGMPLPLPIGPICMGVVPIAESADSLVEGDVQGSVDTVIGGVPVVGNSVGDNVDTGSVTESVEDVVGDQLGSLSESSLGGVS